MFDSGEMESNSRKVDIEELFEEDPKVAEKIFQTLHDDAEPRKLQ
jgi:hypothetical protein